MIVIDGILLFVDARVRELCDVKVFVDADADIRLIRRIRRDMAKRGRPLEEILEQYLSTVQPMHLEFVEPSKRYADMIVPRGGHNPVAIEMIVAKIQRRLQPAAAHDDAHAASGERILVVDDEPDIVALVAYHLAKAGYRVSTASTGTEALDAGAPRAAGARRARPHAARHVGYEVLEQLRADDATRDVAVLMLTARREEPDRIRGLSLGADDYLTKPFSPQELVLRVGAILRRVGAGGATQRRPAAHRPARRSTARAHRVRSTAQPVELTPTEFKLLLTLAERRGRVQARAHLLETVWEAAPDIQTRTVDMHVQRLRTKLGAAGDLIETVRGFGYRLRAPQSRPA